MAVTNSIVDYLNSLGQPSSFSSRKKLAQQFGISNYTGTADQNTKLLNTVRQSQPQQANAPQQISGLPLGARVYSGPGGFHLFVPKDPLRGGIDSDYASGNVPEQYKLPYINEFNRLTAGETSKRELPPDSQEMVHRPFFEAGFTDKAPFIRLSNGQIATWEPNNSFGPGYYTHGIGSQSRLSPDDVQSGTPLDANRNPIQIPQQQGKTGDPTYDLLNGFLSQLAGRGLQINPNIDITNDSVAQLINQYYATQGKLARDNFLKSLGYAQEDILRHEQQVERDYGINLKQLGEFEAERGLAQSGTRQLGEQQLAQRAQEELDVTRRLVGRSAESSAAEFAQRFGTANVPSFNLPSEPRAIPGQPTFQRDLSTTPFYQLSPEVYGGLTGSEEFKRIQDIEGRKSQLESAQRTLQSLPGIRSLTL